MALPRELIRAVPHNTAWHVVVTAICGRSGHAVLARWPIPSLLACCDTAELEEVLQPTRLHRNQVRHLQQLSHKWHLDTWLDLRDLNGVGLYVADAVGLYCFGCTSLDSNDEVLHRYAAAYQGPKVFRSESGEYWNASDGGWLWPFCTAAEAYAKYLELL